jgi:phosphoenolpyruvate carboxykinase (ATP)
LVNAAIDGTLIDGEFDKDRFFGLDIPKVCPGVPAEVLDPRNTWSDKAAYDATAGELVELFRKNFEQYKQYVSEKVAKVM